MLIALPPFRVQPTTCSSANSAMIRRHTHTEEIETSRSDESNAWVVLLLNSVSFLLSFFSMKFSLFKPFQSLFSWIHCNNEWGRKGSISSYRLVLHLFQPIRSVEIQLVVSRHSLLFFLLVISLFTFRMTTDSIDVFFSWMCTGLDAQFKYRDDLERSTSQDYPHCIFFFFFFFFTTVCVC